MMRVWSGLFLVMLTFVGTALFPSASFAQTLSELVSANNDDAEESSAGTMNQSSTTLRLGSQKWVGVRFHDVGLPQGCTILDAYVEFYATATSSQATQLTIFGHDTDDAWSFGSSSWDITNRTKTTASVPWSSVENWTSGTRYQTPSITSILQELVDRTYWGTTSDVGILIRSDDLTGSRTCQSYNGGAANAPKLVVVYTTSSASNTPETDRLYVERYGLRTASAVNTWHTIDLSVSPFNIPPNKVVEIGIANTDTANEQWGGVRAVGSSLDRRLQLVEADGGGCEVMVMHVQSDASSKIQIYASSTSAVTFGVLGYWTSGTYTEKMQSLTVTSSLTWQDRNLGTYGVGANQVAEIVMTNSDPGNERLAGVRSKGSSLSRLADIHEAFEGGISSASMLVRTNKSSDATIQAYAEDYTDVTYYLVGYWSRPPGIFTEMYTNAGVPSSTNVWQDKDLTASGVPDKAVVAMQLINTDAGADKYYGVRENGSSNGRLAQLRMAKDGGGALARFHVTTDSNAILEWYSSTTDPNKTDLIVSGYWESAPANVLMVAADKQTPSSGITSRISLLEGWGYTVTLIDDGDAQSAYDAALPYVDFIYVPQEADASVGTKIGGTSLGIVSEHASLVDDFGFSAASAATTGTNITIASNSHYITSTFATGSLAIFSTTQPMIGLSGTQSNYLEAPGTWSGTPALVTLEASAKTYLSPARTRGRRVQLPWGGAGFDVTKLNSSGQTIMKKSCEWASALKGYWELDETTGTLATDSSGNGHNASLAGGQTFAADSVTAKIDRGLTFNGVGQYAVAANSNAAQLTSALTISAWVRGNSWKSGSDVNCILRKGEDAPNNWQLSICGGRVELILDNTDDFGFKGNTTLTTGEWHHVAATWDGSTVRIYVDGVLDNTPTTKSSPLGADTRSVYLGGRSGTDCFAGALDEVRLYNYALSATEIGVLQRIGLKKLKITRWVETQ